MPNLFGMHDREGRHIVPAGGWCVDTVALSENPQPTDYTALRGDINWIVRLNWGYGSTGTIPLPHEYEKMSAACALYVAKSRGAHIFIIGNEPNHEQERPNGVYITPAQYAQCFIRCRNDIKYLDSSAQVIPAPCAPYHANPANWLDYWREMLEIIAANGGCDGIAVHAYTRSSNPKDINSDAEMGAPLEGQYSGFRTYQDALDVVPESLRHLPAYITEFNELLNDGWHDANTGVVQTAYRYIDFRNQIDEQEVHALILYRWPNFDKWHIEGKQGVIDDFQAAVASGDSSLEWETEQLQTFIPAASSGTSPVEPTLPPRQIDPRAIERGVTIEPAPAPPGQPFWFAKSVQWLDEQQSQGRHHILGNVWKDGKKLAGVPLLVMWPGNSADIKTEDKSKDPPPFDYWYNFPMSPSLSEYGITVWSGYSEVVNGIGMGADGNSHVHTCTVVEWELVMMQAAPPSTPTGPIATVSVSNANVRSGPGLQYDVLGLEPFGTVLPIIGKNSNWWQISPQHTQGWISDSVVTTTNTDNVPFVDAPTLPGQAQPAPQQPQPPGDNWQRSIAFVRRWEGGFANDPNDPGGATNMGITIDTLTRWRKAHGQPQPTVEDLRNLSSEEGNQIYLEWYWLASGADKLAWPLCLIQFDTAVNAGVGKAQELLQKSGGDFLAYTGHLIDFYARIDGFQHFGRAWMKRRAELLLEASK